MRHVRKWLEDPSVVDEHRLENADLLEKLKNHLARYPSNRMHIVTRHELDECRRQAERAFLLALPDDGQTRH